MAPHPPTSVHWWHSLRVRLAVLFVILLGLVLSSLGIIQYLSLRSNLITVSTHYLTGVVNSEVHTPILVLGPSGTTIHVSPAALLCESKTGRTHTVINRFAQAIASAGGPSVLVGIFSQKGQQVGSAPAGKSPPVDPALVTRAAQGGIPVNTVVAAAGQLVVADPLASPRTGRLCAVVEMSRSMTQINELLLRQVRDLVAEGVVALVVGALLTLGLTEIALRPLQRLENTARLVAGGNLKARSPVPLRHDEVASLAATFNQMADQVEGMFGAQEERTAAIRQFTADLSHELRTPLTSIRGYLDVLQRGAVSDTATMTRAVDHMHRHVERMSTILANLLQLARIDAKSKDQDVADLNQAVTTAMSLVPASLARLAVLELTPAPLLVRASMSELESVVQNLFDNACKYAPGSRQHWKTTADRDTAILEVADDGPGINSAEQAHIFERFYRGTQPQTAPEGTGLGLAIVAAVARASGGDAQVFSPGPGGKGAVFQISFGLAPAKAADIPAHDQASQ